MRVFSALTAATNRLFTVALLLVAVPLLGAASCSGSSPAAGAELSLTVFAAASLGDAFQEMAAAFQRNRPDVTITLNFAGSQQLAQQLVEGAPADVFASANAKQMDLVVAAGLANQPKPFATNRLAIATPVNNPAGVANLGDLALPGVKVVIAAATVPAGAYTRQMLAAASADPVELDNLQAAILANVVSYEQNVRAVLTKITLGEADAGIVYASDVTPRNSSQAEMFPIPSSWQPPIIYPIVTLANSNQPDVAADFVAFVRGSAGQAILERNGFSGQGQLP